MNASTLAVLDRSAILKLERRQRRMAQAFAVRHLDAALRTASAGTTAWRYAPARWPTTLTGRIGRLTRADDALSLRLDPTSSRGDTVRILMSVAGDIRPQAPLVLIVRRGHLRQAQFGTGRDARTLTVEDWLTDPPFDTLAAGLLAHFDRT